MLVGRKLFTLIFLFIFGLFGGTLQASTTWTTGHYSNNADLSQTLSISGASSLTVTISGSTESSYDYVYVYDANGNQVKRLTGSINETFTVSGSSIRARLTSDYSVTRSGVTVTIASTGGSSSDSNTGSSSSGGGNTTWTTGHYSNNADLSQTLSISGASSLTVTISGSTESSYDYVYVYDANGNQVKRLTGSINETFTVSGSSIRARLTSDYSVTRSGVTVTIASGGGSSGNVGSNMSAQLDNSLEEPRIVSLVDGNGIDYEYIAILVFPESINEGVDYATHIGVHQSYLIKKIALLKDARSTYNEKVSAATTALAIAQTETVANDLIGLIPLYGDLVGAVAGQVEIQGHFIYDLNNALNQKIAETEGARDLIIENPRGVKYLLWIKRNPNYSVPASFEPLNIETYRISR